MNEQIVQEILKIAAGIPVSTLIETLRLRPEQGSISVSQRNLSKILKSPLKFELATASFVYNKARPLLHTEWLSKDGDVINWDFRGYNTGENIDALLKAIRYLGVRNWNIDKLKSLKPGKAYKIL